jgi:Protein of unknown function (DUF3300)
MATVSCMIGRLRRPALLGTLATLAIVIVMGLQVAPARTESADTPRNQAQLEQVVAPIALYPDALLSQVLMAGTYPLEVGEAARWSRDNSAVTGQALEDAMQEQSWDPSVKSLTAVPQTLQMMNDKLDWTQQLGDAFLAQQQDVLAAIQRLRTRADAAGNLNTTEQQKVARVAAPPAPGSTAAPATVYTIEPATPDDYYVPIYDPGVVYGSWPYPDYPPFYWHPPGYVADGVLSFTAGVIVAAAIWGRVDWWQHRVNINVARFNRFNHTSIKKNTWVHDPAHRGNLPYRDRGVAARLAEQSKAEAGRSNDDKQAKTKEPEAKGKAATKSRTATRTKKVTRTKQTTSKKASRTKQAGR